jgi:hypothetical protein
MTLYNDELKSLERLADLMDSRFVIPGTSIRFGIDSLIGLIPGLGDTVSLAVSAYIIGHARKHNVPSHVRARMIFNAFFDWLIGLIPFIGDIFDVGWKANRRNIALLRRHATPGASVNKRHVATGAAVDHGANFIKP